tara:strand:- start:126 stop:263 length:138 start_codon:yes stop_codon:yes gene_type:complete
MVRLTIGAAAEVAVVKIIQVVVVVLAAAAEVVDTPLVPQVLVVQG